MNLLEVFALISSNLIPVMFVVLVVALIFRYAIYRSGKRDYTYFKSFASGIEKILENEDKDEPIRNVEGWLGQVLEKVVTHLPDRNLRHSGAKGARGGGEDASSFRHHSKETFKEFAEGRLSIVHSVKQQAEVFRSTHPPSFSEVTDRVLNQDKKWTTVLGIVPLDKLSRMLDILPGLFIIGGIFGTFLGITAALPTIAMIDLSDIQGATPILNAFVENVAFSMNTSISGIICSVVMTILNTLFPVAAVRAEVKKSLARCFEFMWYRVHGDHKVDSNREVVDQLKQLNENLLSFLKSAREGRGKSHKAS